MIGPTGEQIGVVNTNDALVAARENDLDLVLIADSSDPPVAKIMDFVRPRFADLDAGASAAGPSTTVPGTVTVVEVAAGDRVAAGQTLVVLEAMKMEHRITADADGVVMEVLVAPGQSVDAHQVVAVLASAEADA